MKAYVQPWLIGCLILCACETRAATVTVNIAAADGASAEGVILVFDPLDAPIAPAHGTASIDQVNRRFVPPISVIQTGTAVTFPNSDQIRHQVYSFSAPKVFQLKLYAGVPVAPVTFDKPGLVVLGCNIHDRMSAFVAVVDSPYFAKASANGQVMFDLPHGRYRLRVWHPQLAAPFAPLQIVAADAPLAVPVAVTLTGVSGNVAAWPD